jgi:hypothetical protein
MATPRYDDAGKQAKLSASGCASCEREKASPRMASRVAPISIRPRSSESSAVVDEPRLTTILKLANGLGVEPGELVDRLR